MFSKYSIFGIYSDDFSPPVNIVKMFIRVEIPYNGTLIDMIPLLVSLIFTSFHFVFQYFQMLLKKKKKSIN